MRNCHDSKVLEQYIGERVEITFFDDTVRDGHLEHPAFGSGYILRTVSCDIRFYKSHIRKFRPLTVDNLTAEERTQLIQNISDIKSRKRG